MRVVLLDYARATTSRSDLDALTPAILGEIRRWIRVSISCKFRANRNLDILRARLLHRLEHPPTADASPVFYLPYAGLSDMSPTEYLIPLCVLSRRKQEAYRVRQETLATGEFYLVYGFDTFPLYRRQIYLGLIVKSLRE
jgi:hypothetical protein